MARTWTACDSPRPSSLRLQSSHDANRPLDAVTDKGDTLTTLTHTLHAITTAFAVVALAVPVTSAAAEPKNGVPFIAAKSTPSVSGDPKKGAPFVAAIIHHPTPVERIVAQEQGRRGDPLVFGLQQPAPASVQIVQRPGGFDWGDAGIGGAATLALVLLVAGGAALRSDSRRTQPMDSARSG
jgi:hypothetical protein